MTIEGWVCCIGIAIIVIMACRYVYKNAECIGEIIGDRKKYKLIRKASILLCIICLFIIFGISIYYYNFTTMGSREMKTQESTLGNGLNRTIKVYSVDGTLIEEYSGRFDIEYDDDRILFDDENGNRHIIFYPTGTVSITEKE
jgi:hypothetical protein